MSDLVKLCSRYGLVCVLRRDFIGGKVWELFVYILEVDIMGVDGWMDLFIEIGRVI